MQAKISKILGKLYQQDSKNTKTDRLCNKIVLLLTDYCTTENNLLDVYRFLKRTRYTVDINRELYPMLKHHSEHLLYIIDTEIEIIQIKIKEPDLRIKIPKLLKWTDTHNALVELIYGIHNLSINFGKGKLEEIAACFEFIFQIKLGNISDKFGDIFTRSRKIMYIDRVKENIIKKFQKY